MFDFLYFHNYFVFQFPIDAILTLSNRVHCTFSEISNMVFDTASHYMLIDILHDIFVQPNTLLLPISYR